MGGKENSQHQHDQCAVSRDVFVTRGGGINYCKYLL